MRYWLFMFRPDTYAKVKAHQTVGVRHQARKRFARLQEGDRFVCYISQVKHLDGHGELVSDPYEDDTPLFGEHELAYRHRCKVRFEKESAQVDAGHALWSLEQFLELSRTTPTNMIYCKGGFVEITSEDHRALVALVNGAGSREGVASNG